MQRSSVRNYDLQLLIGEGSYGKVYKAQRKSDKQPVAIKVVNIQRMDKIGIQSALNEIRILHSVTCENIVGYYEAFLDNNESHLWIVMEFVGGGDLAKAISVAKKERKSFPEKIIWVYLIQCLRGLAALNRFKIIHRDIKPANLFISEDMGTIKLGDMNVSKVAKNDLTRTQIGTPSYLAPEVWENKPYDARCDIFSLGACIYELTALKLPFDARSMEELKGKIKNGTYALLPGNYSEGLKTIIYKCLTKNPSQRPTAEKLLDHPLIVLKSKEYGLQDEEIEGNPELMRSIILPKNLSSLNSQLPKKNHEATRSQSMRVLQTPESLKPSAKMPIAQSIRQIPIIPEEPPEKQIDKRVPSKADVVRYQSNPAPQSEVGLAIKGVKIQDAPPSQRDLLYEQIRKGENIFSKKKDDYTPAVQKPVQKFVIENTNQPIPEEKGDEFHSFVYNMSKMNLPLKPEKPHDQSSKALYLPIQQPVANQINDPKARFSFGEKREAINRYSDIHVDRIPKSPVASPNGTRQNTGGRLSIDENRKIPPSPVPRRMPPPKTPSTNVSPHPQPNSRQHMLVRNSAQQGSSKNISHSPTPGSINRINSARKMSSGSKKDLLDKSNPPTSNRNISSRAKLPGVRLSVEGNRIQSGRNLSGVPLKKAAPVTTHSGKSNPPRPSTSSSNNQPRGSARKAQPASKSPIQGNPVTSNGVRQSKVTASANQSSKNSSNAQAKSVNNLQKKVQYSSNISSKAQQKIFAQPEAKKGIKKLDEVLPKFNSQKASFVHADGNLRKSTDEAPQKQISPVSPIRYRRV